MIQAPQKSLTEREKGEILLEASRLEYMGVSAAATLRQALREIGGSRPEPSPSVRLDDDGFLTGDGPLPDDPALEVLEWAASPISSRSKLPPEMDPLSLGEQAAIRTALEATRMGIEVWSVLKAEMDEEEHLRSRTERERGRLTDLSGLSIVELLNEDRFALRSFRVRKLFYSQISTCDEREARLTLKALRRTLTDERAARVFAVTMEVDALRRFKGMTEAEAVKHVATHGVRAVRPFSDDEDPIWPEVEPMSVSSVRALLGAARVGRRNVRHKRPGRNKRKSP